MNKITTIPICQLLHHPENPRKDLGDLTELAESIKQNGIMQNLTVVQVDDGLYNVVIGNRRMAAAEMAGLEEVPCVISEMDYKTQVATMLMENMQRQDLTVFEQAQGFQMMMDLGYTAKEIGEKTGFSEKTVKDRIKFTKFNQKNFESAVAKGATLMDMIEISKLESKSVNNSVMRLAGTNHRSVIIIHRKHILFTNRRFTVFSHKNIGRIQFVVYSRNKVAFDSLTYAVKRFYTSRNCRFAIENMVTASRFRAMD